MLTYLQDLINPCITKINEVASFVNKSYAPYATNVNIASCFTSIGLTLYGLYPLWAQNNDLELSSLSRPALTFVYALHIGAVSFALADTLGQQAYSPALTSALIGATAMFKSVADYAYESSCAKELIRKHMNFQAKLNKENKEFNRYLILVDELSRSEYEFKLLEEECVEYQEHLKALTFANNGKAHFKAIFEILHKKAMQKKLKHDCQAEFSQHAELADEYNAINFKISNLVHDKDLLETSLKSTDISTHDYQLLRAKIDALQTEIDALGFKQQCWIKYKEAQLLIQNLQKLVLEVDESNQEEKFHLQSLIQNLSSKQSPPPKEDGIHTYSYKKIAKAPIPWLKKYLENELEFNKKIIIGLKELQAKKEEAFKLICKYDPSLELNKKTKALVHLQKQAALAARTERSKEKSANFSVISSGLALLIWVATDVQFTKKMSQIKNGVGFASLVIGNIDMIRKYVLNMRLTAKETKILKQLLQDASFNQIAKVKDDSIRQELFNRIHNLNANAEISKPQSGGQSSEKIYTAVAPMFSKNKSRNKDKLILTQNKQKAVLVSAKW